MIFMVRSDFYCLWVILYMRDACTSLHCTSLQCCTALHCNAALHMLHCTALNYMCCTGSMHACMQCHQTSAANTSSDCSNTILSTPIQADSHGHFRDTTIFEPPVTTAYVVHKA